MLKVFSANYFDNSFGNILLPQPSLETETSFPLLSACFFFVRKSIFELNIKFWGRFRPENIFLEPNIECWSFSWFRNAIFSSKTIDKTKQKQQKNKFDAGVICCVNLFLENKDLKIFFKIRICWYPFVIWL